MSIFLKGLALFALGLAALLALAWTLGAWRAHQFAKAHPPSGDFIEIGGVRLHYRIEGPERAQPILILHGAFANLEEPRAGLAPALEGYRAIYLDRPGLGWSERPAGPWSPQREAALIAEFLSAIGVEETLVAGHSWGGAIALRLALDHPKRVSGLLLLAPAARAWVGEAAWYNKAARAPLVGWMIPRIVAPLYGPAPMPAAAEAAFSPEPKPAGYIEASALRLGLRPSAFAANAADMAQVNPHLAAQEVHYDQIEAPTIILAGPQDTVLLTARHSGPLAETMPNAELRLIEGAGHNLHHTRHEAIAEALAALTLRARAPSSVGN